MNKLMVDYRLGGFPEHYLAEEERNPMQVPDEIRKCVVFVCFNSSRGRRLAGTAFLTILSPQQIGPQFGYIVTAKHVINGIRKYSIDGKVLLRANKKDGSSGFVATNLSDWKFHPDDDCVDVAISTGWLPRDKYDYIPIPIEMAATSDIIKKYEIGIGDEVFLTGLFSNHFGKNRNLPIVRVGNIALMPEEPVNTKDLGSIDAYLIEARSIGGLSGSPVFVYLGMGRIIEDEYVEGGARRLFYWLGLMHGHFDIKTSGKDDLTEDALTNMRVNMGIAIVIPVFKILEVINQDIFRKEREMEIEAELKKMAPIADIAKVKPENPPQS